MPNPDNGSVIIHVERLVAHAVIAMPVGMRDYDRQSRYVPDQAQKECASVKRRATIDEKPSLCSNK
ncbi:MAG: hypothetical protein DHS20C12_13600 [Pseudohongiella sp.]|nr:MAG: hypothetical protein DHS20C12_13600 [Pseudohongiella sp.]